jgi:hypothetical protein
MSILIHPSFFPNIATCVGMVNTEDNITFEVCDSYQKQTYRNRTYIYSANGKIALNVPVKFSQNNRQLYKDVQIANEENWQLLHWKSLLSAYRTSPFFEFYEHEFAPLFHSDQKYIMAFNFKCLEVIIECLQYDLRYELTTSYHKEPPMTDLRFLINARKEVEYDFEPYTQVFSNKHGYINNLSVLDLLFNEGPNALNYLKSQVLKKS